MGITRLKNIDLTSPKAVEVEGFLTDLEEVFAKNGNPFVRGILRDGKTSAMFKHWDITLGDLYSKYKLPEGKKSIVVQIKGQMDLYENQPQIIVKGGIAAVTREGAVDNYVSMPPYTPSIMMNAVAATIIKKVGDKTLNYILDTFFKCNQKKMEYTPYSCEVHSEKCGWLHHTYNLLAFKSSGVGEPKKAVVNEDGTTAYLSLLDSEVMIAALCLHNITPFESFSIDPDTGAIEDKEVDIPLDGIAFSNVEKANSLLFPFLANPENPENPGERERLLNVRHCIAAINGLAEPRTPEAFYSKNLVNLELETYKACSVKEGLQAEQGNYSLNGEKHTLVKL